MKKLNTLLPITHANHCSSLNAILVVCRWRLSFGFFAISLLLVSYGSTYAQESKKTKVVIGIVVDAMRPDYLERFKDRFSEKGIKLLMNDGYNCMNVSTNYLRTVDATGHASLYTGTVPSIHGIIGNDWFDTELSKWVNCVGDPTQKAVGVEDTYGTASPWRLKANTIGDQLKLASISRAKVFSIGSKDRCAILPAGQMADAAYYEDRKTGKWITTTFFLSELPTWLKDVNNTKVNPIKSWTTLFPIETYKNSTSDDVLWESKRFSGEKSVFPKTPTSKDTDWLLYTPFSISKTFDFAKTLIKNEALGNDEYCDLLNVGISAIDLIGHEYGPYSIEMEDAILRLDRDIESFIKFLDDQIGEGNYLVFFTSVHGIGEAPIMLKMNGLPSGSVTYARLRVQLTEFEFKLKDKFGDYNWMDRIENDVIYLNQESLLSSKIDRRLLVRELKRYIESQEIAYKVVDLNTLSDEALPEKFKRAIANSFYPKTQPDLVILSPPNWVSSGSNIGSSHGSIYNYDSRIPLIWYGAGIPHSYDFSPIEITDIAPTLCLMLGLAEPNASIGNLIEKLLNESKR